MRTKGNNSNGYFGKHHIRNIWDSLFSFHLFFGENQERQECSFKNEYMCSYSCGACVFEEYYKINASQKWR